MALVADRRHFWRAVQFVLALLVIGIAVGSLARNWAAFQSQQVQWVVRPWWLLGSVVTVLGAFALLIESWRRVVVSQGQRLGYLAAARIWMLANLGRYLPGKVWALAGAAVLSERAGVDRGVAITSALVLQGLALAGGLVVIALTAPTMLGGQGMPSLVLTAAVGAAALAGIGALASGRALGLLQRFLPARVPTLRPIPGRALAGALAANIVAWAAYGFALLLLCRGLTPDAPLTWPVATAVFASSYLVGLLALFAPAGLGPRESIFILLLTGPLGPKLAVGLALASRVLLTLTELGAALPFLLFPSPPDHPASAPMNPPDSIAP